MASILRACSLFVLFAAGGCHQAMYDATSLPPQLAARPVVDVSSLDLSTLAGPTANPSHIRPGDQLQVVVASGIEQRQQDWKLVVAADGTIDVPLVGSVHVAGQDPHGAQMHVRHASMERGLYRRPSVSVSLAERRQYRVTVSGGVESPGTYEIPAGEANLLAAIVAAGGLSESAGTIVEVRQPRETSVPPVHESTEIASTSFTDGIGGALPSSSGTYRIDLVAAASSPESRNVVLQDGAIVHVEKQKARHIQVIGLVDQPGRFEIPAGQNLHLLDAIAMARGTSLSAADHVILIRQMDDAQPTSIEVSISDAKENPTANILLTDGDVVSVEETPATLTVGAIKQFIRIGINGTNLF